MKKNRWTWWLMKNTVFSLISYRRSQLILQLGFFSNSDDELCFSDWNSDKKNLKLVIFWYRKGLIEIWNTPPETTKPIVYLQTQKWSLLDVTCSCEWFFVTSHLNFIWCLDKIAYDFTSMKSMRFGKLWYLCFHFVQNNSSVLVFPGQESLH